MVLGAGAQHGCKQVLLPGKVGAVRGAGAAASAFGWDVGRPRGRTVLELRGPCSPHSAQAARLELSAEPLWYCLTASLPPQTCIAG